MNKIKRRLKMMIVISLVMTLLLGSSAFANESEISDDPNWEIVKKDVSEWYPSLSEAEQTALAAKIYQEKYVLSRVASVNADEETNEDFVDIAYLKNVEEETYIAELISAHSGIETTTDAWRYNLNYLKLHYDEIMAIKGVNSLFVNLYMEAYESELYMEVAKYVAELISEHSGTETTIGEWRYNLNYLKLHYDEIMAIESVNSLFVDQYMEAHEEDLAASDMPAETANGTSSYDATVAVAYAKKYYKTYNSEYPDWSDYGGDCANFVSQCLYAGGKSMEGTPGTSAEAQRALNWFSTGSSCDTKNVSSSWRGANAFKNRWSERANNKQTFSKIDGSSYAFGYVGDAISLLNDTGRAYHTLIIVGYVYDTNNPDFIVAAHTTNTQTAHLSEYSPQGGFTIFRMQ